MIDPVIWKRVAGTISYNDFLAVDDGLSPQATKSDDAIVEDILTPVIEEHLSEEEGDEVHILPAIPTSRCWLTFTDTPHKIFFRQ